MFRAATTTAPTQNLFIEQIHPSLPFELRRITPVRLSHPDGEIETRGVSADSVTIALIDFSRRDLFNIRSAGDPGQAHP
jgi:hypothetical protein